ncbi:fibroblast growth factor 10-like [Lampetra fluviatilis]
MNSAGDVTSAPPHVAGRVARSGYRHLRDDVRCRKLYAATEFFLNIDGKGNVTGTRTSDCKHNVLEITAVEVGVVAIRGVESNFFLAMDKKGRVYSTKNFGDDCRFWERIEENGYNTYASRTWRHADRQMFLALNGKGVPRRGTKTRAQHPSAHFLPMLVS